MSATDTPRTYAGFDVERHEDVPLLQGTAVELRHESTGARLLHFAVEDEANHLSSVLPADVEDDTGWPHVLEHCVLYSRSRHYSRTEAAAGRRWLATGGGAWTGPDFTHYHAASPDAQAFCELIDFRLDQLFEPELDDEVFWNQIRLDVEDPADAASPLTYRGIIYNEQKGIAGLALMIGWDELMRGLFPGSHYAHVSGGHFLRMPSLTPERLRQEHSLHYHPSRARFVSWGPAALDDIAAAFDAALRRVPERPAADAGPPAFTPLQSPAERRVALPATAGEDSAAARQVLVGWPTVGWQDGWEVFLHELAVEALLRDPASPVRRALLDSGLGGGIAESLYEYGWRPRVNVFATGLKGAGRGEASQVAKTVTAALERASEGIDPGLVDGALRRLELSRRLAEADASSTMLLLTSVIPSWSFGGDPLAGLKLDEHAARLRSQPGALETFVRERLVENPGRATVSVEPDAQGIERLLQEERGRLVRLGLELAAEREELAARSRRIAERQAREEAEAKAAPLPATGGLDCTVPDLEPLRLKAGDAPFDAYIVAARGVDYVDAYLDLSAVPVDLLGHLPVFTTALKRALDIPGGVEVEVQVFADTERGRFSPRLRISARALPSDRAPLAGHLLGGIAAFQPAGATVAQALAEAAANAEERLFFNASENVRVLASSRVRSSALFLERATGYEALDVLRAGTTGAAEIERLRELVVRREGLELAAAVSSAQAAEELARRSGEALSAWPGAAAEPGTLPDDLPDRPRSAGRAWSQAGAFNAQVYRVPGIVAPGGAAAAVALIYAGSDHVRPQVAGRGTAYGAAGMAYPDEGIGALWSIRDPHVDRTYRVFDEAVRRVAEEPIDGAVLHRSRIDAWKLTELGLNPVARARRAWADARRGVSPGARTAFRERALNITDGEVREAAASLGRPGRACMGPKDKLGLFEDVR